MISALIRLISVSIWIVLVRAEAQNKTPNKLPFAPNFLLILADDLGYGDTSVSPFVGSGVKTPQLEKMAARGAKLTNYHTAAATCTPTRASILTGLYPWRMGLKAVFEYGVKGKSNRDDWLPRLPTMPAIFGENNYTTFHSGKWHVGGMRNDDHDMRLLPDKGGENVVGSRRCPHPGPIQQGFQDYVSVLDGPGAPRQNHLQVDATLYSQGCQHLLHNDKPINRNDFNISGFLSHCEARHAMRVMEDSVKRGIPFYVQVWFHAPHGPWEEIPEFHDWYPDQIRPRSPQDVPPCNGNFQPNKQRFCRSGANSIYDRGVTRFAKYRTMVSDMDKQIGMLLDFLKNLGIEERTLVVFSSDNGPEDAAGSAGPFRGNKRHVYEGGIRVPAIAQWPGVIPSGSEISSLIVSTDWLPTFVEAAGLIIPNNVQLDGHSALPILAPSWHSHLVGISAVPRKDESDDIHQKTTRADRQYWRQNQRERLVLWHNDFEGPRRTVAWFYDFKLFLDEREIPLHLFDMRNDHHEKNNLLPQKSPQEWQKILSECLAGSKANETVRASPIISRFHLRTQRSDTTLLMAVVCRMYPSMVTFVNRGDEGNRNYLQKYPELRYKPTPFSDQRPALGIATSPQQNEKLRRELLDHTGCGSAPCGCSWQGASRVPTLPFPHVDPDLRSISTAAPWHFINASAILGLH